MIDEHGTVHLSNSLLSNTFCDTRVLLSHHHRLTSTDEAYALVAGKAAHEALAVYLLTGDPDEAAATYALRYQDYGTRIVPADHRLNFPDTAAILHHWMTTHPPASLPFEIVPEYVEIAFELPLTEAKLANGRPQFVFGGRLDAIVRDRRTGALYVLDHKTTNRIYLSKYALDSQMSGYVWAAQQTLNQRIAGFYINAIGFAKLPEASTTKCRVHKIPYLECRLEHAAFKLQPFTRSPAMLTQWQGDAAKMACDYRHLATKYHDIESLPQARTQGTFYNQCDFCFARDFCAAGRPIAYVESLFAKRPERSLD